MSPPPTPAASWTVIVPVKRTRVAKSRLKGFSHHSRALLARAFALDTIEAALACPAVDRVLVVTNEQDAEPFSAAGALVVLDRPDAGLNPALVHGARVARRDHPEAAVAALSGDLPALTPQALATALDRATGPYWFVCDTGGVGTTMLAAAEGTRLAPAFGRHSRAAHRRQGAVEVVGPGLERLRRDVDTAVDLWDATRLGVGAHTRAALASTTAEPLA